MNELADRLLQIARSCGITDAHIIQLRRHPCLVGTFRGQPFKHVFPGTPSDYRSGPNTIAGLKRRLGVAKSTLMVRSSGKPRHHRKPRHQQTGAALSFSTQRPSNRGPTRLDRDPFAALEPLRIALVASAVQRKSGVAK
jgi:hypothetical protein